MQHGEFAPHGGVVTVAQGTNPLLGAYVKYQRAEQHFRDLVSLVAAFKESGAYQVVIEDDPQTGQQVARFQITRDIPTDIPLRTGEVIQCLRSALDYVACETTAASGGWHTVTRNTAFKFYRNRQDYEADRQRIERSMGKPALLALDAIQPYPGGNDAIVTLCELNNREKHRFLVTAGIAYMTIDPGSTLGASQLGGMQLGAGPAMI